MSAPQSTEQKDPTLTDLWNDRALLTAQISDLVKPFMDKYRIHPDDIDIRVAGSGCWIKVTL